VVAAAGDKAVSLNERVAFEARAQLSAGGPRGRCVPAGAVEIVPDVGDANIVARPALDREGGVAPKTQAGRRIGDGQRGPGNIHESGG